MSDIATLGIKIDSSDVKGATAALGQLANAAKPAAAATADLTQKHSGLSAQSQAAFHSTRSLIEAIAAGVPVSQALSQQISHLSFAATGPGGLSGAFGQVAKSLLGLLSPTTLVIGGFGALAAASVFAVHSIAQTEKAFEDTSKAAGVTIGQLHDLASAAAFKGIDANDFLKAIDKFAADVYQAKNNAGGLAEVFRANGQSASTFTQYLEKAADLIKNATSDQQRLQILQQIGLPATMEWVRFLSQGGDGIRQAAAEAAKWNETADQTLVAKARQFDEAWSKTWTNFQTGAKSAIVSAAGSLESFGSAVTSLLIKAGVNVGNNVLKDALTGGSAFNKGSTLTKDSPVGQFYSGLGTGAPGNAPSSNNPTTVDPAVVQRQIQLQQQYIGLLGQTASAADSVKAVELAVQSARLSGVSIDQKKVEVLKALAAEQALGITQIKAQVDAENISAATVGLSVGQAAQYTAVQNALNEARRNGRTLTDANIAAIKSESAALGQAAQNADNMRFAFDNLVQGPLETFTSQISQGASALNALKAAGQSALNAIAKKLADIAASNLWSAAFGGNSGGGLFSLLGIGGGGAANASGSIAGAIGPTSVGGAPLVAAGLHGGGGPGDAPTFTRVLPAAVFDTAPRFHSGIGPGERAAVIRDDESVLTPGQMKQLSPVGSQQMNVTVGVSVDNDGNLQAYVKNVAQDESAKAISGFVQSSTFVDHVGNASRQASTRRLGR